MREMRNSNLDILGNVPAEWELRRLKFLCDIKTGDSDTQDAEPDGIYPFYVRSPIIEHSNKYTFSGKSILMAGDGAGAGRVFHSAEGKYAVHQRVYIIYDVSINHDFLFYYLSSLFPFQMDKGSAQSTVPSVRLPMLNDFLVCVPDSNEQKCIVKYIKNKCSKIDEAISRHRSIIEKLEEYRRSTIIHAATHGIETDAVTKNSGQEWIKTIPSTWDLVPLRTLFKERKNKNKEGLEKNLLSLSYGSVIRKDINTNEGLLPENFNGYNIIENGDIVLRLTDLQNDKRSLRTGLVKEHGIITSAYVTLAPVRELSSRYYRYLLHSFDLMKGFYSMGEGIRQNLNYGELSRMTLPMPAICEQNDIADYLDSMCSKVDEAISRQKTAIEKLEEYKKSIIYNAVTGKIDCRNISEIHTTEERN